MKLELIYHVNLNGIDGSDSGEQSLLRRILECIVITAEWACSDANVVVNELLFYY